MANEVEIVVSSKDKSKGGFDSARQSAERSKRSFADLGEKTDELATKSSTAYGAMGALGSGIELSRLKAQRHAQALAKQADALDKSAEAAHAKVDALTKTAEADGKVTAAEQAQIRAAQTQADKADAAAKAMHEKADKADEAANSDNKLTIALMASGLAFDAASGVTDLATLALKNNIVSKLRNVSATVASTVAEKSAAVASKAWAAAQWLLNAALSANPIGLVIVAIALLVAGLVLAWKKSETFRAVMTAVFKAVSLAVIAGARFMLNAILDFVSGVLHVMGKLPGPLGAPFRKAAEAVDAFRGKANRALDSAAAKVRSFGQSVNRLPSTKTVVVRVKDLATGTIRSVQREIDAFTGRVIAIQVGRVGIGPRAQAHGGIVGAQGGGPRSRLTMVGEHGRELVDLPPGSRVHSNPDTERLMNGTGGGVVEIEIKSGGSKLDDLIVEIIRKAVRVKGGGNVQIALGRA